MRVSLHHPPWSDHPVLECLVKNSLCNTLRTATSSLRSRLNRQYVVRSSLQSSSTRSPNDLLRWQKANLTLFWQVSVLTPHSTSFIRTGIKIRTSREETPVILMWPCATHRPTTYEFRLKVMNVCVQHLSDLINQYYARPLNSSFWMHSKFYHYGSRTRRLNTANAKPRYWTRFWGSSMLLTPS